MAKLLVFSIHNTVPWWRYVISRLRFVSQSVILSDMRGDGDVNTIDRFYGYLNSKAQEAERFAVESLTESVCDEIIERCRVLRCLDRTLALLRIEQLF